MFFTQEKFSKRAGELGERRYLELHSIFPLTAMEDVPPPDEVHRAPPPSSAGRPVLQGESFEGRDRYLWLEKTLRLPEPREGCDVVGLFDFGRTGGGGNSGFEALLYVDGHPYQGVDSNHRDVLFTPLAGREVRLTFLLWSGLEGGGAPKVQCHRLSQAQVGYVHRDTEELFYLADAIAGVLPLLPREDPDLTCLEDALEHALRLLDWDADRLYLTVPEALAALRERLCARPKRSEVTVHTVGHTHIDVSWLWRLRHTREKAIRSFATVLRLMEEDGEYRFLQTQPQLYRFLKDDCPELYEKIRQRVREGRWETDGGMWLEADCNLTSGESLVRQFLHGISFFEEEFGVRCRYLWLPDVFGYSWALPQIMAQCGLSTFMTTKISWNQYNTIPNDLFRWRGIDGTEMLTYFVDVPDPGQDLDARGSTYNGKITPYTVLGAWKKFKNKDLTRDVLLSYGYGDGGGGPTRQMLRTRRALDALPGVPHVKADRAGSFFEKIHRDAACAQRPVPVWDGELYLEYHRGTYTSQARNKYQNRKLEFLLAETEWLSSLALLAGGQYDQGALHQGWETLLLNQFHDIIPGSSIHEVYEDSQREYAEIRNSLERVRRDAFSSLARTEADCFLAGNFGSFFRRELLELPETREGRFWDDRGTPLPSQRTADGTLVLADLAPLSTANLRFVPGDSPEAGPAFVPDLTARTLETPFYRLRWGEDGALTELYDLEYGRDVLEGRGNLLRLYEDRPMNYDAWDIDLYYTQKYEDLAARSVTLVENGPLRAVLRFEYLFRASRLTQDLVVYSHSRRVDFVTHVDWREDHRLLKALFETNLRATKATYDIQFGHVERPTHWNTSWDWARFEVCGHKWADLSETGYGLSLLNDCKYGYAVHDGTMSLSLLKSAKHPDYAADMGGHRFTYSLLPHGGSVADGGTIEEGVLLNLPAVVRPGRALETRQLLRLSSDGVCVDAVKRAEREDCLVVRLHECRGGRHQVRLTSDYPLTAYAPSNPLEEGGEKIPGAEICFEIRPFELKTFKLWFES